jgi:hypothetical protein
MVVTGKELCALYLFVFDACREQWRDKEEELLRCPLFTEIRWLKLSYFNHLFVKNKRISFS